MRHLSMFQQRVYRHMDQPRPYRRQWHDGGEPGFAKPRRDTVPRPQTGRDQKSGQSPNPKVQLRMTDPPIFQQNGRRIPITTQSKMIERQRGKSTQ